MLGQAAVTMWWDIPPAMKAEFEDWHTHEHMPDVSPSRASCAARAGSPKPESRPILSLMK